MGMGCSGGCGQAGALQTLGIVQPGSFSWLHREGWQNKAFSFNFFPSLEVDSDIAYKIQW